MADGTTAADRLERLLHIFPAASAEGGVSIEELARELGVDRSTVLSDLTQVTARSYYHPAGSGDDIQIRLDSERVAVWTTGAFQRPVKLSPLEAFCLALGLRREGRRPELLERVESHLASGPIPDEPLEGIHATDAEPDPEGVRDVLVAGARERSRCRIEYLKPAAAEPEVRVVHPYAVAHAEGSWYVVGWCEEAEGARAFRLDRILDAGSAPGTFELRDAVDVDAFLGEGQVYHADREIEVAVRYAPSVARWVEEWAPGAEPLGDGGVLVRHRVADPDWIVRHVLQYGGEAVIVEPVAMRERLVTELERE